MDDTGLSMAAPDIPASSEWTPVVVIPLQNGWTAMMFACQEGHEHVVEALLKGGATVDIQDEVTPDITSQ